MTPAGRMSARARSTPKHRATSRGEVVIIEWQTTRIINGARFEWRGVDKFRIRDGKIISEQVYCDTAPLRALRTGETLEPITRF